MSRYSHKNKISEETKDDALKVARGTQKPGQTKEQTRLIAQGIQKGIDLYKKQYKVKARELDRKLRKLPANPLPGNASNEDTVNQKQVKNNKLPWVLLVLSWSGFIAYSLLIKY